MATLIAYRGLSVLDSASGAGGAAINDDLKTLVDWNPKNSWSQSSSPGSSNDQTQNYYSGSTWSQTNTATPRLFVCRSSATGAAVWDELAVNPSLYAQLGGVSGGQTLNGGTASGNSLTLSSTTDPTKGKILFGTASAYDETNKRLGIGTSSPSAGLQLSGNQSQSAWGTSGIGLRLEAASYTDTSSTGTVTNNAVHSIGAPTLLAQSAVTYTNASTLFIDGPPTASTNVTATNRYAVMVNSGDNYFGGNLMVGSSAATGKATVQQLVTNPTTISYGVYANAQATIASNNGQIVVGSRSNSTMSVAGGFASTHPTGCIGFWGIANALGAGNVTGAIGISGVAANVGSGTLTNAYSFYANSITNTGGGSLTNAYGFYAADQTVASSLNAGIVGAVSSGSGKYNLYMLGTAVNYLKGYLGVGDTPVTSQAITATLGSATDKGLVIKAAASQSGDLAQFQNSSGTVLASITSAGRLSFNATGTTPSNTTTPAAWLDITVNATSYKLPLYS